jgi:hypothetical protein
VRVGLTPIQMRAAARSMIRAGHRAVLAPPLPPTVAEILSAFTLVKVANAFGIAVAELLEGGQKERTARK